MSDTCARRLGSPVSPPVRGVRARGAGGGGGGSSARGLSVAGTRSRAQGNRSGAGPPGAGRIASFDGLSANHRTSSAGGEGERCFDGLPRGAEHVDVFVALELDERRHDALRGKGREGTRRDDKGREGTRRDETDEKGREGREGTTRDDKGRQGTTRDDKGGEGSTSEEKGGEGRSVGITCGVGTGGGQLPRRVVRAWPGMKEVRAGDEKSWRRTCVSMEALRCGAACCSDDASSSRRLGT